jgi:general secretion pathway protein J
VRTDRPTARRGTAGFTLVELLVALTLFALLSVLLFGGLRFGTRATAAGTARLEAAGELAAATGFLRAQLADAQPLTKEDPGGSKSVAFEGEAESMEFATLPPAHLAAGGWYALHLAPERAGGSLALKLTWRLVRTEQWGEPVAPPLPSTLIDHLARIECSYFGVGAEGEAPKWHDSWHGASSLPLLVRVRLTFADGSHAPDLVVALRAAVRPPES